MNSIVISGQVENEPVFSHECFGEKFYRFYINSKRNSGTYDVLPVIVSDVFVGRIKKNEYIEIEGTIRTRNIHTDAKTIVDVFVLANRVLDYVAEINEANIEGYICKPPTFRETPFGRMISDLHIASNRRIGKSDYIPCIAWGRNAVRASVAEVGTKLYTKGRLQSREYVKKHDDGTEEKRMAYEVSLVYFEMEEIEHECEN